MKLVKILKANKKNEIIYEHLLSGKYKAQLTIDKSRPDSSCKDLYAVDVDFLNNDLCISSWMLNFYCRTNKAVKGTRYKSFGHAIAALKKLIKKYNIKVVSNLRIYSSKLEIDNINLFNIEL